MIVIRNDFIPFGRYTTINLFGILFTKKNNLNSFVYNHESIHSRQIVECALLGLCVILCLILAFGISAWWLLSSICTFYIMYGIEYTFIRLFHTKQYDAYLDVSFEEEAHVYDTDVTYLKHRKPFTWIKYLKFKSYGKY